MKVVELGHGARAIEPDRPADRVESLSTGQLKQSNVSEEAIDIFRRYVERRRTPS
jgi:hypothetical protein